MSGQPSILVIDNYDSFVYNLVQYLGELGAAPIVHRNDSLTLGDIDTIAPDGILISPGPGSPKDAGLSNEIITRWGGRAPILGVCLGLQCIGEVYGGDIVRAPEIVHGKTSLMHHSDDGIFRGLPSPLEATRYHSLMIDPATLPSELTVTARTDDGLIMGARHRELDVEGVQFHPESILTTAGHTMMQTFIDRC